MTTEKTKMCRNCRLEKPVSEFHLKNYKQRPVPDCIPCTKAIAKAGRALAVAAVKMIREIAAYEPPGQTISVAARAWRERARAMVSESEKVKP